MSAPIRVRFAPSPTGDLHLGSLRTVIFNYLVARQAERGTFVLRVEDTDQARIVPGSLERLLEGLRWMELEPDEGVGLDPNGRIVQTGPFGPYIQSERLEIYKQHSEQLIQAGTAYRCFCTPERLAMMREEQERQHLPPRYDRRCRDLSAAESERRAAAGEKVVVRQAMPAGRIIKGKDIIRGELEFMSDDLDDQVLLKSDGFPTYQLASVVDDHLMEITLVLRGEEWIPSLPKNLLLYEAFGWQPPEFAHVPVILGPDGKRKLSKREGAGTVLEYREKGYLPQALLNALVMVGWSPGTEEEFFSKDELIKRFRLEKVQRSPAVFSFDRLEYVNGWYIRQLPASEVVERMLPYLEKAELLRLSTEGKYEPVEALNLELSFPDYLLSVAGAVQERLKHFDESAALTEFFFRRPEVTPELLQLLVPKKSDPKETMKILSAASRLLEEHPKQEWQHDALQDSLRLFIEKNGYPNGAVLWPLRAALSGRAASPGAFELLAVLGREEALARLRAVAEVS